MSTGDPPLDFALSLRSAALTPIMKGISDANGEYAYLVLIPLVYWLFSRRVGFLLLLAAAAGTFTAVFLKASLGLDRPPNSGETSWLANATGKGFPSGHTTATSTTWASLAVLTGSRFLALVGVVLTLAVAFSRLYLGVHYTRDVLGGALLGLAIALFLLLAGPRAESAVRRLSFRARLALLPIFPALALLNASTESLVILSATGGAALGEIVSARLGWELARGSPRRLPLGGSLRVALGLPVLVLLPLSLGSPSAAPTGALIACFSSVGVFVTLLGPRLFQEVESRVARPRAKAAT